MSAHSQTLATMATAEHDAAAADLTYFAFLERPDTAREPAPETGEPLPPLPEVLAGRYRLERLLGVGGMGAVYRARDLLREQFGDPDPYVAVKLLNDELAEHSDASALLYSEFALTLRLRHPHIVRPYSFEVDNACRRAFITLELMRGPTLDQLLCDRPQGLPWGEFRGIALPLLDALAYSHQQGVLHGDLKPSNVILTDDGPRLFDYGLGQACAGLLEGLPQLSRERFSAWTPRYAAPEVLEGAALSPASDLYSMACLLYELHTGHPPYNQLDARQATTAQLQKPAQLPHAAWRSLRTALALKESKRCIDANDLRDALAAQPGKGFARWFQRRNG